ncbi:methyl- -binding domain-containing 5-like isoform X2 [Olea europaea subsp. europaea]|uniref:Methyl- -binding domain-containing 5-like isoform X2 n=1 Tax=Olea europaea subsp. europaea TaxID=158383 RepID=A0A8S0QM56_OLEEU|nr:methyl- -binding domain-containing 5-like isoform X2 [Olea europaea subsp. europaea]
MVDGNSLEWLLPGFAKKTKYSCGRKIKYYCNLATGTRYYSKWDVLRCAERENVCYDTPQATSIEDNKLSDDKTISIEPKTTDSPEWLPHGWIIEERTRKSGSLMGKTYMVCNA